MEELELLIGKLCQAADHPGEAVLRAMEQSGKRQ